MDDCSQARETRAEFGRQRSSLGAIQTRMVGVLSLYIRSLARCATDDVFRHGPGHQRCPVDDP